MLGVFEVIDCVRTLGGALPEATVAQECWGGAGGGGSGFDRPVGGLGLTC